jgi:serine/threonine-protein kinase RsbW
MRCGMRVNHPPKPEAAASSLNSSVIIPARDLAVRDGLKILFNRLPLRELSEDDRGTVEIVLAEALNNIVEHAYASSQGDIEISLSLQANQLQVCIIDSGLPMPDGTLPTLQQPEPDPQRDLPEGGFGWFLIRSLSKDLSYRRDGPRNLLCFRLDTKQPKH